ncbi:response regulator [Alphaproteobacteria bacterium GH1-50]|uniref:Response regulator n=1 Tax=Kangsaoukella pontilimi TaxID=2691042 RepID=A0A7C9IJ58_9RHOB|nr:response regulator [Kangsaoukella pontilimi]MXQ08662.1 response regulator [Kangsaoukella pontilimi]
MPETLDDFLMTRPPTAERPLLGQTILVVEDSRFTCEALRMICQRSGARIRRADSLRSAERHLRTYRPGIVLIDVGLPDGSGLDLIRKLSGPTGEAASGPVVLAMSGDDTRADEALAAGAQSFIAKPITSISAFQTAILAELPRTARPTAIRPVSTDEVFPDRIALRDDLSLADDLLSGPMDSETQDYVAMFLFGVARASNDDELEAASQALRAAAAAHDRAPAGVDLLRRLVANRLAAEHTV